MADDMEEGIAFTPQDAPVTPQDGGTGDGEGGGIADTPQEGGQDGQGKAEPEAYELTAGDDFPMPEDSLQSFTRTCREAGLTKEQAEKVLGWHREQYAGFQQAQQQEVQQVLSDWHKEIRNDAEFGGRNWKSTVASARKAFEVFDPDGSLRAFLRESQYQHNPMVIRAVARVGRAMGEHGYVGADGRGGDRQKARLEDRLWPDM